MSFQEADAVGSTEDVVKYAYQVRKFDEIPAAIKNAFYVASTGRPGPVVVDIPRDIFYEKSDEIKWPEKPTIKGYRPFRTIIDPISIKRAAEMLINAERPVIMTGTGVVWSNATKEVLDLAETLIAPIVSTLPGKSAIPHDHPLYLGAMGYYGRAEASMAALESDLMFVIGARLSDRTFTSYDEW